MFFARQPRRGGGGGTSRTRERTRRSIGNANTSRTSTKASATPDSKPAPKSAGMIFRSVDRLGRSPHWSPVRMQRARSEGPHSTRVVGDYLGHSLGKDKASLEGVFDRRSAWLEGISAPCLIEGQWEKVCESHPEEIEAREVPYRVGMA